MENLNLKGVETITVDSGRIYVVFAKKGSKRVAVSFEMSIFPPCGNAGPELGMYIRFFGDNESGFKQFGKVRSEAGHLSKISIRMCDWKLSGRNLRKAFTSAEVGRKIFDWLKEKVEKDGGVMVLEVDYFNETMENLFAPGFVDVSNTVKIDLPEKL